MNNEEHLHRFSVERNILRTITIGKANWNVHMLHRNCLLEHVTVGKKRRKIDVMGRRGIRRKQLPDNRKGMRSFCKLKEEALDRYEPIVRQTAYVILVVCCTF